MDGDAFVFRMVDQADFRRVGRIDFKNLDPSPPCAGLEAGEDRAIGKAGEHPRA